MSSSCYLLDVNVLIALVDFSHVHHPSAHSWLKSISSYSSCPITENGFVRVISNSSYPNRVSVAEAVKLLVKIRDNKRHQFWSDEISLADEALFRGDHLVHGNQITDLYLLGLAKQKRGKFATFDSRIDVSALNGRRSDLIELVSS